MILTLLKLDKIQNSTVGVFADPWILILQEYYEIMDIRLGNYLFSSHLRARKLPLEEFVVVRLSLDMEI